MNTYPARAVIDHGAIRANTARLREVAGEAMVMAVVKSDAYGHGIEPVARTVLEGGATWLGAAQVSEALGLRNSGISAPILSWLFDVTTDLTPAVAADIDLSASAPWALEHIAEAARRAGSPANVHLKVDTGMGRAGAVGEGWPELCEVAASLIAEGSIALRGIWSHLACADEPHSGVTEQQVEDFEEALDTATGFGLKPVLRHLANSAGTLWYPETHYDMVRAGIALYGLSPAADVATEPELGIRPAMRLESSLVHVKDVPADTPISYGHTYRTKEAGRLGLVPVGYADGVPRGASPGIEILVGDLRVPTAGTVCMDQTIVDLGAAGQVADVRIGERVVLFGPGDDGEATAGVWAEEAHTINYEIVTRIGCRVPREHEGVSAVHTARTFQQPMIPQ